MEKRAGKTLIFMVIGCVLCYVLFYILLYPRSGNVKEFYKQEEDTIDVLLIGTSNIYSNINPAVLWDEHGIAAYNLAGSAQPIWNTYYYLREAYKTQSPKLVVLDVFGAANYLEGYDELSNVPVNTLSLKWSFNKLDCMRCSVRSGDFLNLCLGLPIFHNRWTRLFSENYLPWQYDMLNGAIGKGFQPVFYFGSQEAQSVSTAKVELSEKNAEYLKKIIDLTREEGSELLLIKTPYVLGDSFDAIFNGLGEMAEQNKIPFINMNKCIGEIGFDFGKDMADTVHMNNLGAVKVTSYLGDVIKERYAVADRRGDKRYDTWQDYSSRYEETLFMCPEITGGKTVVSKEGNLSVQEFSDQLFLASLPVKLEKDTYYKIRVDSEVVERMEAIIDVYAADYDFGEQKRKAFIGGKDNDKNFVIIKTDEKMPEDVSIRVYSSDERLALSGICVEELETR